MLDLGAVPFLAIMMGLQYPYSDMTCHKRPGTQIEWSIHCLNSNILPFIDVCENFQNHACGLYGLKYLQNYVKNHKIQFSTHQDRYEYIDKILLTTLKTTEDKTPAIQKAKDFFGKCLNEDEIQEIGTKTIKQELKRVGFDETQISSPHSLADSVHFMDTFDYVAAWARLLKYPTLFANFFMFRIEIVEDVKDRGQYVPLIVMDPNESVMIQSAEESAIITLTEYFKPKIRTPQVPVYSFSQRYDPLQRLEDERSMLWSRLEEITKQPSPVANNDYIRTNLEQLQVSTDTWMEDMRKSASRGRSEQTKFQINWKRFFEVLFEDVPNESGIGRDMKEAILNHGTKFVIYLSDAYKFKKMIEILAKTPPKIFALSLYLASVINVLPMGPEKLQEHYFFNAETKPKMLTLKRERMCLAIVKDTFRSVVAHELLQGISKEDIRTVTQLVKNTKKTFLSMVKAIKWLSVEGKKNIIRKIETLNIDIPYVHTTTDPQALEDIYGEITNMESMSFYESYLQILRIKRTNEFSRIFNSKPGFTRLEYGPPIDLFSQNEIAKYYEYSNEVEISLIALGHPYYYGSSYLLLPVNLGGLGFHVVRQMVHALDKITRKILPQGNTDELTNDDVSMLRDRILFATKMIPRSEILTWSQDKISWKNSQLEAAADNISLNVCYRVLKNTYWQTVNNASPEDDATELILRRSSHNTPAQYFTLALASTMCKQPAPALTTYINYRERVNELFKHWPEFQTIWDCSDTSEMVALRPYESKFSILSNEDYD